MENTEKIRTVLIDDEPEARGLMRRLLSDAAPFVEVTGEADDVDSGLRCLRRLQPDLIFLDIKLKTGTGFDLLRQLMDTEAEVVFVTAYDEYALRAFDYAALGYLLKPVGIKPLRSLLERYRHQHRRGTASRIDTLLSNKAAEKLEHIVVADLNGFRVLKLPEIIYLRGEVNYSRFVLKDGTELLSSRTLKHYEKLLAGNGFCRIHQSFLINLQHVSGYQKGEGGIVSMQNGAELDVSRRRKREFLSYFEG